MLNAAEKKDFAVESLSCTTDDAIGTEKLPIFMDEWGYYVLIGQDIMFRGTLKECLRFVYDE